MTIYHINSAGLAAVCKADKGLCPFAKDGGPHEDFSTAQEATKWAEKTLAREYGGFSGKRKEVQKAEDSFRFPIEELKNIPLNDPEWLPKHRRIPADLNKLADPTKSANLCYHISNSLRDIAIFNEDYRGPILEVITERPNAPFLTFHSANKFKGEDGEEYVIDFSYSQIDDEAPIPYIAPVEEWRAKVIEASVNPKPSIREKLYDESGKPRLKNISLMDPVAAKARMKIDALKEELSTTQDTELIESRYQNYNSVARDYPSIFMAIAKNPHTGEGILRSLSANKNGGLAAVYAERNLEARGLLN